MSLLIDAKTDGQMDQVTIAHSGERARERKREKAIWREREFLMDILRLS